MSTYSIKSAQDQSGAAYCDGSHTIASDLSLYEAQEIIDDMEGSELAGIFVEDDLGKILMPESPFKGRRSLYNFSE